MAEATALPESAPGWEKRDAEFAAARRDYFDAGRRWREKGGHWPVGGEPNRPREWERVREADKRRRELAKQALPDDPKELIRGLDSLDADAVDVAIGWLEADPFAYRSGYLKQKIMSRLCRAPLSPPQQVRLRALLLRLTIRGPRQEFRDACRLARRVDDSDFRHRLRELVERPEPRVSYAAARMLRACETKGTRGGTG